MVSIWATIRKSEKKLLILLNAIYLSMWTFPSAAFADEHNHRVRGFMKGLASWYGAKFHGRRTASGQIFNQNDFTCAHRTLPFGTHILVKNPETGITCTVVVNDRGPFRGRRALDLSKAAAHKLGITGVAKVFYKTGRYVADKVTPDSPGQTNVASHGTTSDNDKRSLSTSSDSGMQ